MITDAQFRIDFPEFNDPAKYPAGSVNFWISFALKTLNAERWGDLLDMALELRVAHELTIATQNGRTPGAIVGPITSKTVDKISVARDTGVVTEPDAGQWAATSYGLRYIRMARMIGAGGMQL
jgi:hypothetical protein